MDREHAIASRMLLRRIAASRSPPGRLHDAGCGFGHFLAAASEVGWTVSGSDISPAAVSEARARVGEVHLGSLADLSGSYDVVTAWDVIEHLDDPVSAATRIGQSLVVGGLLAITTPDTDSWDARLCRGRWYGYTKVPEHLLYFNRRSIATFMQTAGLQVVHQQQWGFVRSVNFMVRAVMDATLSRAAPIAERLVKPIGHRALFVPAVDMLVLARRVE